MVRQFTSTTKPSSATSQRARGVRVQQPGMILVPKMLTGMMGFWIWTRKKRTKHSTQGDQGRAEGFAGAHLVKKRKSEGQEAHLVDGRHTTIER